jgi:threonine synthase
VFGSAAIVPLKKLEDGLFLEALSNGPTLAFKDMAMQLLGNLFEYELARRGESLNILGATSGDTGSAAEYAMKGKRGIRVFMTSPHGRMSPFQQAQMFSLQDANIHNLAIQGVFDDCQDIVKAVSNDLDFKRKYRIGTVNSINWARLVAQVVYYFAGYFQATTENGQKVSFAVPSGNFGNICAGHVARMMGLPIETAGAGHQRERRAGRVLPHRRLPRALGRRHARDLQPVDGHQQGQQLRALRVRPAGARRRRTRPVRRRAGRQRPLRPVGDPAFAQAATRFGFRSGKSTHADRLATIRDTWERLHVMVDTHTADGLKVARQFLQPGVPMVVLETALPVKFAATIVEALGREPDRPARFQASRPCPSASRCCRPTCSRSSRTSRRIAPESSIRMKVVGFAGYSGSGKTTLIERVIPALKARGLRVSVVKHAHHNFDIDQPGKDTWRHREAGAFEVVVASDQAAGADARVRAAGAAVGAPPHRRAVRRRRLGAGGRLQAEQPAQARGLARAAGAAVRYPDDDFIVAIVTDQPALPQETLRPVLDLNDPEGVAAWLADNADRFDYNPEFYV